MHEGGQLCRDARRVAALAITYLLARCGSVRKSVQGDSNRSRIVERAVLSRRKSACAQRADTKRGRARDKIRRCRTGAGVQRILRAGPVSHCGELQRTAAAW